MEANIQKGSLGDYLEVFLKEGENIFCEPGAYIANEGNVELQAVMLGGLGSAALRFLGGNESLFLSKITAVGNAKVILSTSSVNTIEKITLNNTKYWLGDGAYLAHYGDINISAGFQGLGSFLSGSGLFFLTLEGTGEAFINAYGNLLKKELKEGEVFYVDNTNFVAMEATGNLESIKIGKDLLSSFLSTEFIIFKITGPGTVYYSTASYPGLAEILRRFFKIKK